ncbi:hypothetical protein BC941DRAFT_432697 [Chlamydoabsidia padenii]|nr:hypothetical protein BC941DRAFT_432697 [Chlamydoabsidia padenii]
MLLFFIYTIIYNNGWQNGRINMVVSFPSSFCLLLYIYCATLYRHIILSCSLVTTYMCFLLFCYHHQ